MRCHHMHDAVARIADIEQAQVEVLAVPAHLAGARAGRGPAFDGATGQGRDAVIDHADCGILPANRQSGAPQTAARPGVARCRVKPKFTHHMDDLSSGTRQDFACLPVLRHRSQRLRRTEGENLRPTRSLWLSCDRPARRTWRVQELSASAYQAGHTRHGAACSIRKGLPQKRELAYATSQFRTSRSTAPFTACSVPDAFADWADRAPGWLRLCGEGAALHHAYEAAPRCRDAAGELLRLGPAAAGSQARPAAVAAPAQLPLRRRADRGLSEALPHDTDAAARCGRRHDDRLEGAGLADRSMPNGRCGTHSRSATTSFATPESVELLRRMTWHSSAPTPWSGRG